ncbi:MAG: endonuclease/exonuclease/phosphatase family protein [Myxococcota bacterium]
MVQRHPPQSLPRRALSSVIERSRSVVEETSRALSTPPLTPHLAMVRTPSVSGPVGAMGSVLSVATYNVHRWTGMNGRMAPDPERAMYVIDELDADVIALQEVLRPTATADPLEALCEDLGLHVVFAVTRLHRRGQLGNAILSRFPIDAVSVLDISYSRIERRGALAAQVQNPGGAPITIIATHLSLVNRTRRRQVQSVLEHSQGQSGPALVVGDMNAWRSCKATRKLDRELDVERNKSWPASFPATRPVLALDRVYAHNAKVLELYSHDSAAARKASDHLPVIAHVQLDAAPGSAGSSR